MSDNKGELVRRPQAGDVQQALPVHYTFDQLQRMAVSLAKSGMFGAKTPEGALSLLLIAEAEGIPPVQAMMDYDLIDNKPCLKSAAMLARFQRSGGKVRWIKRTDEEVSGVFSHPSGGEITVTWDDKRVQRAGLANKMNHKQFPLQMKTARCASEAIRAIAPQSIPLNMYTVEETRDMEESPVVSVQAAIDQSAPARKLPEEEIEALIDAMDVKTLDDLMAAFQNAWRRAKEVGDEDAKKRFKAVYDSMAETLKEGAK